MKKIMISFAAFFFDSFILASCENNSQNANSATEKKQESSAHYESQTLTCDECGKSF